MNEQPKSGPPTEDEIRQLPRWARVAFAARCARRVLPLVRHGWKNAPEHHLQALDKAVSVAENAAAAARFAAAADAAHAHAYSAYDAAYIAYDAADAVAEAAEAAEAARYAVAAAADDDARYAAASACAADADERRVRRDFEHLLAKARSEHWTDDTPIPPSVFGPMWPDGVPAGWPVAEEPEPIVVSAPATQPPAVPKELGLKLTALVRGDANPNAVTADLKELYNALNEYHTVHGGSGLTLDQFRFLVSGAVGAGVR